MRDKVSRPEKYDFNRGWGTNLLLSTDKAFNNPIYETKKIRLEAGSGQLFDYKNEVSIHDDFNTAWRKVAPADVEPPVVFTMNGSAANNMLYEIADEIVSRRDKGIPKFGHNVADILAFDGSYAGSAGRMRELSPIGNAYDLKIKSPTSLLFNPTDPLEIARLKPLEDQAIEQIRERVKNASPRPIGGILLEPMLGRKENVVFYRTEFLLRLRKVCDELQIPIFADEILTGGGRTGKFFSYQHYEGFRPDYVTFGKGLLVSGVSKVTRNGGPMSVISPFKDHETTRKIYNAALLDSTQVMNRIREDHLMENAADTGTYFVERLKQRYLEVLTQRLSAQSDKYKNDMEIEDRNFRRGISLSSNKAQLRFMHNKAIEKTREGYKADSQRTQKTLDALNSNPTEFFRGMGFFIYSKLHPVSMFDMAVDKLLPVMSFTKEDVDNFVAGIVP